MVNGRLRVNHGGEVEVKGECQGLVMKDEGNENDTESWMSPAPCLRKVSHDVRLVIPKNDLKLGD